MLKTCCPGPFSWILDRDLRRKRYNRLAIAVLSFKAFAELKKDVFGFNFIFMLFIVYNTFFKAFADLIRALSTAESGRITLNVGGCLGADQLHFVGAGMQPTVALGTMV